MNQDLRRYQLSPPGDKEFHKWKTRFRLREYLTEGAIAYASLETYNTLTQGEWAKGVLTGIAAIVFIDLWRINNKTKREELEEILEKADRIE